jgi:hypothetical protein
MVDVKPPYSNRNITSTITTDDRHDIYDTINENFNRALNEIASFQPQYLQSISNLQLDCIQTVKNMIHNMISAQKNIYNRATDELSKYNTNMAKAWNSFFAT